MNKEILKLIIPQWIFVLIFFGWPIFLDIPYYAMVFVSFGIFLVYKIFEFSVRLKFFLFKPPLKVLTDSGYRYCRICNYYDKEDVSKTGKYYIAFFRNYHLFWVREIRSSDLRQEQIEDEDDLKEAISILSSRLDTKIDEKNNKKSFSNSVYSKLKNSNRIVTKDKHQLRNHNIEILDEE